MSKREILLRKISSYAFAIYELKLYLDTHPNCRKTIAKMEELESKLKPLREEYVKEYGPLMSSENMKDYWTWVNAPWPWEGD
ncbi:MAG: spore coat protein CotJB [Eubacteriales bacterium]|nr:spore coat protein CotJB [Eubacteriales bacterium]